MLPDEMPAHFQSTYTPIAAAGTPGQIKHISRLLAVQLTSAGLGKGTYMPLCTHICICASPSLIRWQLVKNLCLGVKVASCGVSAALHQRQCVSVKIATILVTWWNANIAAANIAAAVKSSSTVHTSQAHSVEVGVDSKAACNSSQCQGACARVSQCQDVTVSRCLYQCWLIGCCSLFRLHYWVSVCQVSKSRGFERRRRKNGPNRMSRRRPLLALSRWSVILRLWPVSQSLSSPHRLPVSSLVITNTVNPNILATSQ